MAAKVFLLHIEEAEKITEEYCQMHFPKRLERARRFVRHQDYLRCIGAGALLHGVLHLTEDALEYGKNGKPFSNGMHFNISHSGNYIALATDSDEIGVDIEIIDESHLQIANHVFTSAELAWLESDLTKFHILWTLKESVMKQCGQGFNLPVSSFSVLPLIQGKPLLIDGNPLYASYQEIGGHILSICTSQPKDVITEPVSISAII